jgi:Domain of unknown function (DUF4376)
MNFYWHTPEGRIVQSAFNISLEEALENPLTANYQLAESPHKLRIAEHWIESGVFHPIPEKPSRNHVFDYVAKEWTDPRQIEALRLDKWTEVKKAREAAEFGGFEWDGSTFDSDPVSQSRIQGAVLLASQLGEAFSQQWTLADNSQRTLNAADMLQVGFALATHINSVHSRGRQIRDLINTAAASELPSLHWDMAISQQ